MRPEKVVVLIRSSQFKKYCDIFIKVSHAAYVNASLWDEYTEKSMGNKSMAELANDALDEMTINTDKSIRVLAQIKGEAEKLNGVTSREVLAVPETQNRLSNGSDAQDKLSEALKCYVHVEKDWQALNDLADGIERSGIGGQEKEICQDLNNLFSDISGKALKAINILRNLRSEALNLIESR